METILKKLNQLSVTVGKKPGGHAFAYELWNDIAQEIAEAGLLPDNHAWQRVESPEGRQGFLALAWDATHREDWGRLLDVIIGAMLWEAQWIERRKP